MKKKKRKEKNKENKKKRRGVMGRKCRKRGIAWKEITSLSIQGAGDGSKQYRIRVGVGKRGAIVRKIFGVGEGVGEGRFR